MNRIAFSRTARLLLVFWLAIAASLGAFAQGLPTASPESVGLSAERLERIGAVVQRHIDETRLSGAVTLVARKGCVAWSRAQGMMDKEAGKPMKPDAIFRIYSMTKPITSVAAMILVEEGKIRLSDPVSMYLPELANLKVATNADSAKDPAHIQTRPAKNPIRVLDLLLHTSGFTYGFFKSFPGGGLVEQMYLDGGENDLDITNAELVTRLSKLPLRYDPGTAWSDLKQSYTDRIMAATERRLLPGLRDQLTFVEAATPLTIERFTGNRHGAIYGWALTPGQTGSKRLPHETPVEGLYLSGAWTHEGPGSFRVVMSGVQTARRILARAGRADALPSLRPADLSPLEY